MTLSSFFNTLKTWERWTFRQAEDFTSFLQIYFICSLLERIDQPVTQQLFSKRHGQCVPVYGEQGIQTDDGVQAVELVLNILLLFLHSIE